MKNKEKFKLAVRRLLFGMNSALLSCIPKKKGLVLFTAWFGEKYIDNSRYVYEYFLEHSNYSPVWMTSNPTIYAQLQKEGKPVVKKDSLRGKWLTVRAQAAFSSVQYTDYNTWCLRHCLYVDLGHGHPIKDPGDVGRPSYMRSVYTMITNRVYYYTIVASTKTKQNYNVVDIPQDHIFVSDFARNDVLIDESLQKGKNVIIDDFKKGRKAIVYMPTQRSGGELKMNMNEILPLDAIQQYCEKKGVVFIIKKNFYHRNEHEDLSKYPNIMDVTNVDDIDPQVLLCQADMLISDYSACYIDYMLLRRPIVFFQYDLESFNYTERKLYYNFEELDIAPIVYNKQNLVECIDNLFMQGDKWLEKRMVFAHENYFDNIEQKDGRKKVKDIFDRLYKQYFN